ncbi:hypothetical protein DLAC_09667 [Tieghemostelium lacteum]|uniref:Uncharacterized protein n=1 Tax=Tieghemostelium lacteum TaxID=361077 RepID=A0A151Z6W1_TIELA|nr:hypothetical protein DLAC_09667 [Tieghemostelium lacteum]|eukprot:KYQ89699.1 hypothetical protein DLAC_09667 [Tieghemostelium lacteum]
MESEKVSFKKYQKLTEKEQGDYFVQELSKFLQSPDSGIESNISDWLENFYKDYIYSNSHLVHKSIITNHFYLELIKLFMADIIMCNELEPRFPPSTPTLTPTVKPK